MTRLGLSLDFAAFRSWGRAWLQVGDAFQHRSSIGSQRMLVLVDHVLVERLGIGGFRVTTLRFLRTYAVRLIVCFTPDLAWLNVIAKGLYQRHIGHRMRPDVIGAPAVLLYLIHGGALVDLTSGSFRSAVVDSPAMLSARSWP